MEMLHSGAFYAFFMTSKDLIMTQHESVNNRERAYTKQVSWIPVLLFKLLVSAAIWSVTWWIRSVTSDMRRLRKTLTYLLTYYNILAYLDRRSLWIHYGSKHAGKDAMCLAASDS